MKQISLFDDNKSFDTENIYVQNINVPLYRPRGINPNIRELFDTRKYNRLIQKIEESDIDSNIKDFLKLAATRHIVFNYEKIADYYANSNQKIQELFEDNALVVIDFNKAYSKGYINLAYNIANQYFENYGE